MTDYEPGIGSPVRVGMAWLLGAQAVLVLLLAPGDGGRCQSLILPLLWAFDVFFSLAVYCVARYRHDRSSGISLLAAALFVIGSFATAVVGTYAMFDLNLI